MTSQSAFPALWKTINGNVFTFIGGQVPRSQLTTFLIGSRGIGKTTFLIDFLSEVKWRYPDVTPIYLDAARSKIGPLIAIGQTKKPVVLGIGNLRQLLMARTMDEMTHANSIINGIKDLDQKNTLTFIEATSAVQYSLKENTRHYFNNTKYWKFNELPSLQFDNIEYFPEVIPNPRWATLKSQGVPVGMIERELSRNLDKQIAWVYKETIRILKMEKVTKLPTNQLCTRLFTPDPSRWNYGPILIILDDVGLLKFNPEKEEIGVVDPDQLS